MKRIIYDLDFDALMDTEGVFSLSVVKNPACESNFVTLSEEKEEMMLSAVDDDRRLLVGAALVPDKEIIRKDGTYIRLSQDVVRKCMETFFKRGYQENASIEHDTNNPVEGVCIVESWIVEDTNNDKSNLYGIDVPKGTWMVAMKCENEVIYNAAKKGEIRGFSIEGKFPNRTEVELSKDDILISELSNMDDDTLDVLSQICEKAHDMADSKQEAIEFIKELLNDIK